MNKKRLFGLFVFSLLAISLFTGFVSAQSMTNDLFDPIKDMFASWQEGDLSVNIAKYLFLFLITMVIFSILEHVPIIGGKKNKLRWPMALLVAFLATAYLTPSDVYTMLAGYGALGMVVGGIVPFLILMYFSIQMGKSSKTKPNRGGQMFAKFIWFVFILFLVWKLIDGMWGFTTGGEQIINTVEGFVYLGLIIAGIIWIWFMEKWVINLLFKNKLESDIEYSEAKQDRRKAMQNLKDREADMELGNN